MNDTSITPNIRSITPDVFSPDPFTRFVSTGHFNPEWNPVEHGVALAQAAFECDLLIMFTFHGTGGWRYLEVLATENETVFGVIRNEHGGAPKRIESLRLSLYEFTVTPVRVPPLGSSFDPLVSRQFRTTGSRGNDHATYRELLPQFRGIQIGAFS